MPFRRAGSAVFKRLPILLLLACCAQLLAQTDIRIIPIPQPYTDTGVVLASPKAAAVATPSAPGAWGGVRSGAEATLSERVADYRIEATLDPVRHTVSGKQRLTWRNRSKSEVRSVYLHLYMNAFEGPGSTFMTEQRRLGAGWTRAGGGQWGSIALRSVRQGADKVSWAFVQPDNGPASDRTVVRFDLPAAVAAGASTTFDIEFLTQLPRVIARAGYVGTFHMVGQWFPKIGVLELPGERGATTPRWNVHEYHLESEFYADFGHYDVKLTVPKGYTVGATGQAQGAPVEKNGMLTHHFVQGDVHDFAFTADARSAPPMRDTWRMADGAPVQLTVLYPPDRAASAAPAMKAAKDALSYFSAKLGPYPYRTLTLVIPPFNADEASAMEYPTLITVSGHESVAARGAARSELENVTIHEVGHQYFYGIVASNEFEEPLLDEGVTEFWNLRLLDERRQDAHDVPPLLAALGLDISYKPFDVERMHAPRGDPADAVGQNAYERLEGIGPAYTRSATLLRDLEQQLGKETTERAFKEYYRRWKFRHPSSADLRDTLAEVSGQRALVDAVFAQQVYAVAPVDDRIGLFTSIAEAAPAAASKPASTVYRTSVTVRRRGAAVPQTLLVKFADGSSESVRWSTTGRHQTFSWTKPVRAVSAEIDPQRAHYLDVNKLDDSRTLSPERSASRRWGGDAAALINVVLALIASI